MCQRASKAAGLKTGDGDERLRVEGLKMTTGDCPAAWTIEPYPDEPDYLVVLSDDLW